MKIYTLADITANGNAQQVSTVSQPCKWIRAQGVVVAGALGSARVGDSSVSVTRGIPITTTLPVDVAPISQFPDVYDLIDLYVIGTNNDKISITYAV